MATHSGNSRNAGKVGYYKNRETPFGRESFTINLEFIKYFKMKIKADENNISSSKVHLTFLNDGIYRNLDGNFGNV